MTNKLDQLFGWYGALAILIAYTLISFNILNSQSIAYQILNATGAAGVAYISLKNKTYQPGILNLVWTMIALVAIVKILI